MIKFKIALLIILLASLFSPSLQAYQQKKSSLYYVEVGITHPPSSTYGIIPSIGLGMRWQRDYCGLDLSANIGTLIFTNYASLKGIFLIYPQPAKRDQIYFGIGPGMGYHLNSHGHSKHFGSVTVEGVLGYEYRLAQNYKTFIQLALTQPAFHLSKHSRHYSYKPGIALIGGVGF